jgi:hypothetical protein
MTLSGIFSMLDQLRDGIQHCVNEGNYEEAEEAMEDYISEHRKYFPSCPLEKEDSLLERKIKNALKEGVPDLNGPFNKRIVACEWSFSSDFFYGHDGFSLHKNYEIMKKYMARRKERKELSQRYPRKKEAKEIFVNSALYRFVYNKGLGVYVPKERRKFREIYSFIRGQYGRIFKGDMVE